METDLSMPNHPLPPGFFPLEEECGNCHFFCWRPRTPEEGKGWAYCNKHKTWFPHQLEEGHTPAGARHCPEWVQKWTVKE